MSEQSDAVILVVSEETGAISLAYDSKLYYDLSPIEVTRKLKELLDRGARSGDLEQADSSFTSGGEAGGAVNASLDDRKDVFIER
jgi:diadenylate cyclase